MKVSSKDKRYFNDEKTEAVNTEVLMTGGISKKCSLFYFSNEREGTVRYKEITLENIVAYNTWFLICILERNIG